MVYKGIFADELEIFLHCHAVNGANYHQVGNDGALSAVLTKCFPQRQDTSYQLSLNFNLKHTLRVLSKVRIID